LQGNSLQNEQGINSRRTGNLLSRAGNLLRLTGNCPPCAGISPDLSRLAARTDELWRHTCFEAFVRTSPGPDYYEFNFAPSTQWAAYRFDSYRSGIRAATEISAPRIAVQSSRTCYRLQASLEMDQMSSLRIHGAWRIGLAAVIEDTSGHKSYRALVHPPGKADFHHSDSHQETWGSYPQARAAK
jgi:hypothetical protein